MYTMLSVPNELFWEHEYVQKLIKEKPKFDLIITISFFNDAILGLGHHLGIPNIVFHCIGSHVLWNHYVANPVMPYTVNNIAGIPTETFLGRLGTASVNLVMAAVARFVVFPFNQGKFRIYENQILGTQLSTFEFYIICCTKLSELNFN